MGHNCRKFNLPPLFSVGLIVLLFCFIASFLAEGQGTQLNYDLTGELISVRALSGKGPVVSGPYNALSAVGDLVVFIVSANGSPPLSYQWQFNSNNIPGAMTDSLLLTNITLADFGAYRVVVGNSLGSATSSNAL